MLHGMRDLLTMPTCKDSIHKLFKQIWRQCEMD